MSNDTSTKLPYRVFVADNFHYMDPEEVYEFGAFATLDEALSECRKIVDASLQEVVEPGESAELIYFRYQMFGEDPYISGPGPGVPFSAWDYAKVRATDFVGKPNPAGNAGS
jgi:hypothetical protein